MNLDKIDDVLSDPNTLTLFRVPKVSGNILIKNRTYMNSTTDDFGQNFIYANYDGALETNPRSGTFNLFNPNIINQRDVKSVDNGEVYRDRLNPTSNTLSITSISITPGVLKYMNSGTKEFIIVPQPYVEDVQSNTSLDLDNAAIVLDSDETVKVYGHTISTEDEDFTYPWNVTSDMSAKLTATGFSYQKVIHTEDGDVTETGTRPVLITIDDVYVDSDMWYTLRSGQVIKFQFEHDEYCTEGTASFEIGRLKTSSETASRTKEILKNISCTKLGNTVSVALDNYDNMVSPEVVDSIIIPIIDKDDPTRDYVSKLTSQKCVTLQILNRYTRAVVNPLPEQIVSNSTGTPYVFLCELGFKGTKSDLTAITEVTTEATIKDSVDALNTKKALKTERITDSTGKVIIIDSVCPTAGITVSKYDEATYPYLFKIKVNVPATGTSTTTGNYLTSGGVVAFISNSGEVESTSLSIIRSDLTSGTTTTSSSSS